jgi:hypothetical protein
MSSKAVGRWRHYVLTETLAPTNQITWSHNPEDYNFNLDIFIFRALDHYYRQTEYIY